MLTDYHYVYIEDDPLSREVLQVILNVMLNVSHLTMFEDTHDIIQRLDALPHTPDYIFLDIHIDPLDGFAVIERLKASPRYAETRVIAVTASVMTDEIARLRNSGFHGAIGKPLNAQQLPAILERIIGGESVWHIE